MEAWVVAGLLACLITAGVVSLYASSKPDGLEHVAETEGFTSAGEGGEVFEAPMPDYTLPCMENKKMSASLAGVVGTFITFALAYTTGKIVG